MIATNLKPNGAANGNGGCKVSEVILKVEQLRAWYGSFLAIKDITMEINARAITAIIGPSGCGKSTFIRCLNRRPTRRSAGRSTAP